MKKSMPTMKDVAQEAGVALGTVSKVINGIPVGESYRIKVEEAARKLGYQVNQYARSLKTNKTFMVAVILPQLNHPFFSELAHHLNLALHKQGYQMQIYLTEYNYTLEQRCVNTVQQNKVDGIIGLFCNPELKLPENIPFISIDRCISPTYPCVSSDNYNGGRLAAENLIRLGCRHLAFLHTGPLTHGELDKRCDGFESVCRAHRVPTEICWVNIQDGPEPFAQFLQSHMQDGKLEFDGLFCSTDLLACKAQRFLTQKGIRVPEDVQIVGYDGIRRFHTEEYPCSTIVQPLKQMADLSVELLLDVEHSNRPSLICLPVTYAPGGTTIE